MAKELTNRFSDGSQCGSRYRGDFKQSLTIRIIVSVRSSHTLINLLWKGHTPLPILIKLGKIEKQKTTGKKSKYTPQILQAQSWKCFFFFSSLCEQKSVFSPAAACQR